MTAAATVRTGLLHQQLPVVMATDPNVVRFVSLVDTTASELYERVGTKHDLLDPAVAPMPIIRWLAGVLALPMPDDLPADVQRATVMAAARAFPRRGTAASLASVLTAMAGTPVTIEEPGWVRCDPEPGVPPTAELPAEDAEPTRVAGDGGVNPFEPVRVLVTGPSARSRADLERVVERELRADVAYKVSRANESEGTT